MFCTCTRSVFRMMSFVMAIHSRAAALNKVLANCSPAPTKSDQPMEACSGLSKGDWPRPTSVMPASMSTSAGQRVAGSCVRMTAASARAVTMGDSDWMSCVLYACVYLRLRMLSPTRIVVTTPNNAANPHARRLHSRTGGGCSRLLLPPLPCRCCRILTITHSATHMSTPDVALPVHPSTRPSIGVRDVTCRKRPNMGWNPQRTCTSRESCKPEGAATSPAHLSNRRCHVLGAAARLPSTKRPTFSSSGVVLSRGSSPPPVIPIGSSGAETAAACQPGGACPLSESSIDVGDRVARPLIGRKSLHNQHRVSSSTGDKVEATRQANSRYE
mmetsp:Transcript_9350/g.23669  ORF Transcript_9350/g.23669 Transcript_9350/m.23669 type:complete len:329 (+) Transcript_9350:524-1510(+)